MRHILGTPWLAIGYLVLAATPGVGARAPSDSLALQLRRMERSATRPRQGGEAALLLGRLHYARGEYRAAADAFARAAARLDPSLKSEALYWAGLSWLALRAPNAARAALEEVVSTASPRRSEAQLGIAMAWEQAERPDRAYESLERLLADDPGEAGAPALERYAILAGRLHRPDVAERARARLLSEYPGSMEAAAAMAAMSAPPAVAPSGPIVLEAGIFATTARAQSLAARAVRAGFPGARVEPRGERASRTYGVVLGTYTNAAEARKALARAARELGISARLVGER